MHEDSIVVARPRQPAQLVLLFHGVGSSAENLLPLGRAIALERPQACVVSVNAPHASTLRSGREWFSVVGVTEGNRPERIANAMPLFLEAVEHWQQVSGAGPASTVLAGFSQGAIMALESTQGAIARPKAGRVISLAGRLAEPARRAPAGLQFHLVHGEQDGVVAPSFSATAAQELQALGANVTLDLLPGLGHAIDARALGLLIEYVSRY
jgi:phospholipase/carboxylesterase